MKRYLAILFVVLTFIFTWSIEIPTALSKYGYLTIKIPKGIQMLSTFAPGIVAIILTIIFLGKPGIAALLASLVRWKLKLNWFLFAIGAGIVFTGLSILIYTWIYKQSIRLEQPGILLIYLFVLFFLSPLWEEIGWRGFLLPQLEKYFSAIKSSLIIGFVWGLWHLPIILALNPYGNKTPIYFSFIFIGCFALSVLQTWLYKSTISLLACVLFHDSINAGVAYFYANLPDLELVPFMILTVLLVLLATIIYGKTKGQLTSSA